MGMIGGVLSISFMTRFAVAMAILYFIKGSGDPYADFARKGIKVLIAGAIVVMAFSLFIHAVLFGFGLGGLRHSLIYGIYQ